MKKIVNYIIAGIFVMLVASPIAATALPAPVSAAAKCDTSFLGIPPWYRGMTNNDCEIQSPDKLGGLSNFIWRIVLNVLQMALTLGVYVAIFFIIYGGFLFMTAGGNSSQIEKGRKSILDAVIGLVILLGAIAVTNFIFGIVGNASIEALDNGIEGLPQASGEEVLANILYTAYFAAGVVAVVTIIIAGINYVTSGGDSGKVTRAKNMLTFSVVGLVIILAAFAITNFVLGRFG